MSRLAELIEELCPDGVEYRPLGEIADLQRGSGMPKKAFLLFITDISSRSMAFIRSVLLPIWLLKTRIN